MDTNPALAAFVLAGGQSTRMGTDKAFMLLDGRSLLSHALDLARSVTNDVHIVGSKDRYSGYAPTVEDIFPGCGPLAGIHAALRQSQKDLNLMLAVDVPFVTQALLHYLIERAENSSALVIVPRAGRGFQPLCAVYRRAFADAADQALRAGRYKIDAVFDQVPTLQITEDELKASGFSQAAFSNVNTPRDLEEARTKASSNAARGLPEGRARF